MQKQAMRLDEYLKNEGVNPYQFSLKAGVPASTISRFLRGLCSLGMTNIIRIQEATGGKVRVEDLAGNGDTPKAQNA